MSPRGASSAAAAALLVVAAGCGGGSGKTHFPSPSPTTFAGKVLGGLDRSMIERTRNDMNAISTAIGGFVGETGAYPVAPDLDTLTRLIAPAYIRLLPQTDAWGSRFTFVGDAQGFKLTAPGADGVAGTGDDIVRDEQSFIKLPEGFRPAF